MAHEDKVFQVMKTLKIADKMTVGEVMSARVGWKAGVSATNQAYKALNNLVQLDRLEKGQGYFRLPECQSDYGEHARLVTKCMAHLMKFPVECLMHRELTITRIGLRPDILALLIREGREGRCLIIEIVNHESEQSLLKKRNVWENWSGATEYLSELFGYRIPYFDLVTIEEDTPWVQELRSIF